MGERENVHVHAKILENLAAASPLLLASICTSSRTPHTLLPALEPSMLALTPLFHLLSHGAPMAWLVFKTITADQTTSPPASPCCPDQTRVEPLPCLLPASRKRRRPGCQPRVEHVVRVRQATSLQADPAFRDMSSRRRPLLAPLNPLA
jgi:hypothetical protein